MLAFRRACIHLARTPSTPRTSDWEQVSRHENWLSVDGTAAEALLQPEAPIFCASVAVSQDDGWLS
jgi:hypothetical protein